MNSLSINILAVNFHVDAIARAIIITQNNRSQNTVAECSKLSHDQVSRSIHLNENHVTFYVDQNIELAKQAHTQNPGVLALDDFRISKQYSGTDAPGKSTDLNGSDKTVTNGYTLVCISFVNSEFTIPLIFEYWVNREYAGDDYKKKYEIGITLLKRINEKLKGLTFVADGAYNNKIMRQELRLLGIHFILKVARNRAFFTKNGTKIKVENACSLKRNSHWAEANLYEDDEISIPIHCYVQKFDKERSIHVTTDFMLDKKLATSTYRLRNDVEVMHRELKQSLGLCDWSVRVLEKRTGVILLTFNAYIMLQITAQITGVKNIQNAQRWLQNQKNNIEGLLKSRSNNSVGAYA